MGVAVFMGWVISQAHEWEEYSSESFGLILFPLGQAVALVFAFSWLTMITSQFPYQHYSFLKVLKVDSLTLFNRILSQGIGINMFLKRKILA